MISQEDEDTRRNGEETGEESVQSSISDMIPDRQSTL